MARGKRLGWYFQPTAAKYQGGDIHVLPANDIGRHYKQNYCPCSPCVVDETGDGQVLQHHAYDEREVVEALLIEVGIEEPEDE